MSKGLEALEELIEKTGITNDTCAHLPNCYKSGKCPYNGMSLCRDYQIVNEIGIVIKAFDIMLENNVDLSILRRSRTCEEYNRQSYKSLSQEHFNFLKEEKL